MNDKIVECLKNIEIHADVLMKIPSSEQHIGNIQSVVSVALLEIKRCLAEFKIFVATKPTCDTVSACIRTVI